MAVIGTQQDDNQPGATGNVIGGGAGGYVGGGTGQGATTTVAPAPTSSGYTNLTSYMNANQGAGAQMGQGVVNSINKAGNTVLNDQAPGAANGNAQQAFSNAQGAYSNLQGMLGNAQGTMPGTSALLQQTYKQPNYSAGEANLDAALVNEGGGMGALNGARSTWGTLNPPSAPTTQNAGQASTPSTTPTQQTGVEQFGQNSPLSQTLSAPKRQTGVEQFGAGSPLAKTLNPPAIAPQQNQATNVAGSLAVNLSGQPVQVATLNPTEDPNQPTYKVPTGYTAGAYPGVLSALNLGNGQ